ncbi:MAG TPA: hypothetical protein VLE47_04405 [Candidatus Saccharimonadales bacterium]|nr:hypothetical protein [Candidatus Saccharimonadales bacterium]
MESATFLTIVIFLVSAILIAVGVYLILLLNEARGSFKRVNRILDRVETASSFVEESFRSSNNFVSVFGVLKEAVEFVNELKRSLHSKKGKGGLDE